MTNDASGVTEYTALKADVYSFGVLIWAVFSRQSPYKDIIHRRRLNLWGLRDAITGQENVRPNAFDTSEAVRNMDPKLKGLMERCWHRDPDCRPGAFGDIEQELSELQRSADDVPVPASSEMHADSENPLLKSSENPLLKSSEVEFSSFASTL
jgi:hypothetical protein